MVRLPSQHPTQGHPYHTAGLTCLDIHPDSTAAITGPEDGVPKVGWRGARGGARWACGGGANGVGGARHVPLAGGAALSFAHSRPPPPPPLLPSLPLPSFTPRWCPCTTAAWWRRWEVATTRTAAWRRWPSPATCRTSRSARAWTASWWCGTWAPWAAPPPARAPSASMRRCVVGRWGGGWGGGVGNPTCSTLAHTGWHLVTVGGAADGLSCHTREGTALELFSLQCS